MSDARPHRRLRLPRLRPWPRPRGSWAVSQEMGADFAMGPGLLGGFRRQLFAAGFADLGKRRRIVAFQAGSACETAQKFADGVRESLGERGGTVASKNAAFDKQYLSGRYGVDPYLTRIEEWE